VVAKEWWEARWKFVLAAVAILAFVAFAPRPYGEIIKQAEYGIERMSAELESPEEPVPPGAPLPPGYTKESYEQSLRDELDRMRRPDFPAELAKLEVREIHAAEKYMFLVPLATLLGVALVSGEVSRGSIFLLLSRPVSRTRIFFTKYSVGAALLLAVALLGGMGIVISGYAHGYPAASMNVAEILASAGIFWLGTVSVLGVATLASVLFRDVIRSIIATVAALYAIFSLPDLIREATSWWYWSDRAYFDGPMAQEGWYESFEVYRITRYWAIVDPYENGPFEIPLASQQPDPMLSVLVCLIAAVLPLIVALWLFHRKSY
jgi:ABC-type transport system involved in multi-copper enzyme maturation permease subunit